MQSTLKVSCSTATAIHLHNKERIQIGMGPSTCSLDARSVLGLFYGARARVLESEHMLVLARARG